MINISICDDEKNFAEKLEEIINDLQLKEKYSISICTSAEELRKSVLNGEKCDILFMDIELEQGIKGTDVASELKELYTEMLIIYVSSHDTYYTAMVQAEPFRFLTKPVEKESVSNALAAAITRLKKQESTYEYTYEFDREIHIIDLKDVTHIYSQARKIYMHLKNGEEISFYGKLDNVEYEIQQICNMFVRISQSYIVNFNSVYKFKDNKVYIKNNIELSISRKYKDKVTNKYIDSVIKKYK